MTNRPKHHPNRRYYYELDASGSLYHDRTLLKDRDFLDFFFRRLRANDTGEEADYPYLSVCGREWNFVRGPWPPLVFDRWSDNEQLAYNGTSLSVPFTPEHLRHSAGGALLHPARPEDGLPYGRLHSHLLLELAPHLEESGDNYILTYRGCKNLILPL